MTTVITTVPSRANPATFAADADACLQQLAAFSADVSLLDANLTSAVATVTSGLSAGLWVSGTTYSVGNLRFDPSDGYLYRRLTNGAGTTRPGLDTTNWAPQTLPAGPLVVVTAATQTAVKGGRYVMTNSGASELTLPASPTVGDVVPLIAFPNGRTDNWLRRNGQSINGRAEDMLINIPYWARAAHFVGGAYGWVTTR